jgi:hypothetical protein
MTALATRLSSLARAACALTLLAAPGVALAESVDLRPKFEKGAEATYTLALSADNQYTMGAATGDAQKQHVEQELGLRLNVKEVDPEKGATVDLVYESIKFKTEGGMMAAEFDSKQPADKDAGNMVAEAFRPLVGMTLTLTVDKDGNVTEVKGGEELSKGMTGQMLAGYTTTGGVRGLLGPIFSTRQAKTEANVGDTWTYEDVMPGSMLGQMKIVSNHTLKSVDAGMATIDLTGKIELKGNGMGPKVEMKEGSYDGTYIWDSKAGMLKSMKTTQVATMEGDMGSGPMTIKNNSTTTLTRVK